MEEVGRRSMFIRRTFSKDGVSMTRRVASPIAITIRLTKGSGGS